MLNENIFDGIGKRSKGGVLRKEDNEKLIHEKMEYTQSNNELTLKIVELEEKIRVMKEIEQKEKNKSDKKEDDIFLTGNNEIILLSSENAKLNDINKYGLKAETVNEITKKLIAQNKELKENTLLLNSLAIAQARSEKGVKSLVDTPSIFISPSFIS